MLRRHLPVLDGLRGLAIIAVLMRHAAYVFQSHGQATRWFLPFMQFGNWGVDLFFVLSGFLITGILLDTKAALNRARSFYGRRILRIFPVYYLALCLALFIAAHSNWGKMAVNFQHPADRFAYLFYFQNWLPLWHHGTFPESIVGPFWSLAVEEQFYFIWPAIVWHLTAKGVTKLCAFLLAAAFVIRIALVTHFGSGIWVYAFTITRADGLYVGSAIAAILALKGRISNLALAAGAGLGVAGLAAVVVLGRLNELWLTGPSMSMTGIPAIALLSGALIVFCLQFNDGFVARFFNEKWIRTFGKYSYGMYVWHLPIYYWIQHVFETKLSVNFPLPAGGAILYCGLIMLCAYSAAWVSFQCYEQWFLRLKDKFEPVFAAGRQSKAVEELVPGMVSSQS